MVEIYLRQIGWEHCLKTVETVRTLSKSAETIQTVGRESVETVEFFKAVAQNCRIYQTCYTVKTDALSAKKLSKS